jgi:hypothetical protein
VSLKTKQSFPRNDIPVPNATAPDTIFRARSAAENGAAHRGEAVFRAADAAPGKARESMAENLAFPPVKTKPD